MSTIFRYAALLAIVIACVGLLGLASYMTEKRTKEIGIRKVLGASTLRISLMLSKSFAKWVLIANIVAWPIAYIVMTKWLSNYAYRIRIGLWTFLFSAILTLSIALCTVGFQVIRSAVANPVKTIRYE